MIKREVFERFKGLFVGKVTEETILCWDLTKDVNFAVVAEIDEECLFGVVEVGEHRDLNLY